MGTLFAGEGVTAGDDFAVFLWGDCTPAGASSARYPSQRYRARDLVAVAASIVISPIAVGVSLFRLCGRGKSPIMGVESTVGHRRRLPGAGWLTTGEGKARIAAILDDDNADAPALVARPRPSVAGQAAASCRAPSRTRTELTHGVGTPRCLGRSRKEGQ